MNYESQELVRLLGKAHRHELEPDELFGSIIAMLLNESPLENANVAKLAVAELFGNDVADTTEREFGTPIGRSVSKMSFKERLRSLEDHRFAKIIDALAVTDECEKCVYFDRAATQHYMCAIAGTCIGQTLRDELKSYMIAKCKEQK